MTRTPDASLRAPVGAWLPLRSDTRKAAAWLLLLIAHAGLLLATILCAGLVPQLPWLVFSAVVSGCATVHVGFLGHDLEHGQLPGLRRWRGVLGILCWNLLLGVSLRWWRQKHRNHHRETHVAGRDPDLYELFAYETEVARSLSGPHRWFVACQAWLFWPVTAFARAYYQCLSLRSALRLPWRQRLVELPVLCLHHAVLWSVAWIVLGKQAVWFLVISQIISGLYMGLAFSTNHLGMPLARQVGAGRLWQVLHTRNVRTGRLGDYLLGGLNLQIEHHLHPSMHRSTLRDMQPATEARCRIAGIPYHQVGLLAALAEVQDSLHRIALAARRP